MGVGVVGCGCGRRVRWAWRLYKDEGDQGVKGVQYIVLYPGSVESRLVRIGINTGWVR